jgi:hypothetical protein
MTKHDNDAAERAEKRADPASAANESVSETARRPEDLTIRYRALESAYAALQAKLDDIIADNASLRRDLARATERLAYYKRLCNENFGFEPTPPPGSILNE